MSDPLLAVEDLEKHYPIREGLLRRQVGAVRAVDGISFGVDRGETVGLIGESGCGKSTAASTLLRLEEPTGGAVRFDGRDLRNLSGDELRRFRRRASMVFQNPTESFDPKMTVGESVAEPLRVQGVDDAGVREAVVADLLDRCGLSESAAGRYPHELSDGQKQRAALARALVVDPDLLVADEPVSALDVSVQAEVLALLSDLQADLGLSMLVITHDIDVVRELCDRVCVMYLGEIVERGPTGQVLGDPNHPYTEALVDAVAVPDPHRAGDREPLAGDVPDAAEPPAGCRFHPRCPAIVPPEDLGVDADTYGSIVALRTTLSDGDVDEASLRALAGAEGVAVDGDGAATLRRALRATHDLPAELDDETAERAVAGAVEAAVGGDPEAGADRLREAFTSVCEREAPGERTDGDRGAACHRFDPDGTADGAERAATTGDD